ncbi:hypothetical protein [Streptomyces fumanus]|uniref:Uncharacterized protein n=1 Tax=Streptomyces fumanus TaxID=67302 RepID=A0A919A4I2_9ACTN|nr:hypothetical protein [Streptomyces fumanus]GHE84920.1 hypothetical protein GCM10018772_05050 [Streptomyces fumanus]
MTPARRTMHALNLTAGVTTLTAAHLATHHWAAAIPAVLAAGVLLTIADTYRWDDQHTHRAAADDLDAACCETWWTSLGADHDHTCPTRQTRSHAA